MVRNVELCITVALANAPTSPSHVRDALFAVLDTTPIASVVILPNTSETNATPIIKSMVDGIQKRGAAALISDDTNLARIVKADGVHVSWSKKQTDAYHAARAELGARAIIGADAGRSRHGAMELGESGVEYVAFGIPPHVEDRETAQARQIDLVTWWSDIFEVPCVAADITTIEQARAVANAGADFVALTLPPELSASAATAWILAMRKATSHSNEHSTEVTV